MSKKEEYDKVDAGIYDLLLNRDSPENGLTVRQMTRIIWNYGLGNDDDDIITDEKFYNRAKLVERRIGAFRHRIFERIRNDMKENEASKVKRPAFIPYALPVGKYWKYLNAANYEQMPWVVKGLRHKADGLNANAEVLEAVF
jgi:hypothetical protein